ncbi:hypothetical protein [Methyloprofundus sp.]|uniref:hypothetical protein n=1 Tax=Methyloprofundus sp. TaxID=2020875 RepID=UPI003D0B4E64
MKIIARLILVLAISPVHAAIYECEENGIKSYQQFPCKQGGKEFIPPKDISQEEQKAAVEKLDKDLAIQAAKRQQQKEANDKERLIQAQEEKADAAYLNARANEDRALQYERNSEEIRSLRPYTPIQPVRPTPEPLVPR